MTTPLLATKLYRPPLRPAVVLRPRLVARLNAGLRHKLILVAAPAGFGKTTLLTEWLAELKMKNEELSKPAQSGGLPFSILHSQFKQVAWLSLDERDADFTRFLSYFVAALQSLNLPDAAGGALQPGAGALALLQLPQLPPVEVVLAALVNEISAIPHEVILVLDDYHLLESPAIDQALTFLLDHQPPQLHLVIATREDPQLPLARLRTRGELTELRAIDLRFTIGEATHFLNEVMGLKLAAAEIAALDARTEGWIAGLYLAALSLQGVPDAAGFIRSFAGSHRFVLDYLAEEVLGRQPAHVQAFLLGTAILDRLCGALCDAVLGIEQEECRIENAELRMRHADRSSAFSIHNSQFMLEELERANLFLVPLDNERRWYRYHRLFADLLRLRLKQHHTTWPAGPLPAEAVLHRRASAWYEQHSLTHEAFHHAVAAEDLARAADLAEAAWPAMFRSTLQNTTFLSWMQALPDALIRARPVLSLGYAWALLDIGDLEAAEMRLQDAERLLERAGPADRDGSLLATVALARAFLALTLGDLPATVAQAQRALALIPEDDEFLHAGVAGVLGTAYLRSGDLEAAATLINEGIAKVTLVNEPSFAVSGLILLAGLRMAQGRLREAVRIYERMVQRAAEQHGDAMQGMADLYLGLGGLALDQGDYAAACRQLERSVALGERSGLPDWPYRLHLLQARIQAAAGDLAGALERLDAAERHYYRSPLPDLQPVAAQRARIWIRQGRLAEAQAWARDRGLSVDDDLGYIGEFEQITLARLLLALGRRDHEAAALRQALALLARLLAAVEAGGRAGSAIEILMLLALASAAQGDIPAALGRLERALALAEPEGYVRIFLDEGPPLADLLARLRDTGGRMRRYAQALLPAFTTHHAPHSHQPPELAEALSPRELEVLRLIAQGLSNREIGERLHLAESTVKGHNLRIFGKLNVQRRTEALTRARELGLL